MTSDQLIAKYTKLAQQNQGPPQQSWQSLFDQPAKQTGKGGILTSLISELGGAGGAAGGAAIGTAVAPGVGTLAGAILGGLFGGTAGRGVENKVRDNQNFFGAGGSAKTALGEGAMSGALSGVGEGFGILKAAKGAEGGLSAVLRGGADVGKTGAIESLGQGLERGAGGYGIGAKVPGEKALTASGSDAIAGTLDKLGIKAAAPETQAKLIDKKIADLGAQLSEKYSTNPVKVGVKEINDLGDNLLNKVITMPGLDGGSKTYALDEIHNLVTHHGYDTSTLWNYTKKLEQDGINFAANPDATTAGRQVVNKLISGDVRDVLNSRLPGLSETNRLYSGAVKAQDYLVKAASDRTGGGLTGKILNTAPVKGLESRVGSGLESTGKFIAGNGGVISQIANQGIRQLPGNIAGAVGGAAPAPDVPSADMSAPTGVESPGSQSHPQLDQLNQVVDQALQKDLASSGGKNVANILKYYDFASKNLGGGTTGGAPNVTKLTAQQYGLAQGGQQALQQLSQLVSKDPGIVSKNNTPGQSLPLVGGYVSHAAGTTDYRSLGYNIADSILRLRTGAQANESEVKQLSTQLMPRAGDSPAEVQQKIQNINNIFNSYLAIANGTSGSNSSLMDTITQLQGGN